LHLSACVLLLCIPSFSQAQKKETKKLVTKKGERPGSRLTELLDPAATSGTRVNLCVWRPPSWKFRTGRAVFVWAPDAEDFAQRKITDEL
jgi:hypothetical protein